MIDVLGSGRMARAAVDLAARRQPRVLFRIVTARRVECIRPNVRVVDPDSLVRSRAPLVVATSVREAAMLEPRGSMADRRASLGDANLRHVLERLPPRALDGRLVLVVTNPVEPIAQALATLSSSCVLGFGLTVDRARHVEVLAAMLAADPRSIAIGTSGTHSGGAIPILEGVLVDRLRAVDPAIRARRLSARFSRFATRSLDARVLERLPPADAPLWVRAAAELLTEAEFCGEAPPARRGAAELASALDRLVRGRALLVSTHRGPLGWAPGR